MELKDKGKVGEGASTTQGGLSNTVSSSVKDRGGAKNMTDALRHKVVLRLQEGGILTSDGRLTEQAIKEAKLIDLRDVEIKNTEVVKVLTQDGSLIKDWKKFTTNTVTLQSGQRVQVHFYMNVKTGKIDYQTRDFKVKGMIK
ncbi:hypothetical protein [Candidatus Odyssella thessalonicensis]|uniref:hypothetical protein n=1 Tax=Candidatus Odyssella thessalonicensis TaxID=84647 RepID=UPI000225BFB4|nr:hypothetical protein [Candidatus Odyssella thessalonicensis]